MHRRATIFALLLAAVFLLTAGYFFLTGSFFLTRLLLPWVSSAAGCEITVRQASLRLFSRRIILHDFRMGIREQPFLTVRRARGKLQLLPLLQGRLEFSQVELTQARLRVARNAQKAWCRKELGEAFFQDDDYSANQETTFRLCLQHVQVEDSTIEIELNEPQRKFRMLFTEFNGLAENYRNDGTMTLKCYSKVHADGRPGLDLNGTAEWNGKLGWDADFSLNGAHGTLTIPQITGILDGTRLLEAGLHGQIQAHRPQNGLWEFQQLRLLRQDLYGITDIVELAGYYRQNPLHYFLNIQRGQLSGAFLSILSEITRGIRPGDMQFNIQGRISGTREQFNTELQGSIARKAGPAYLGNRKVMLPDFRLTVAHHLGFNWQTRRITVKKLDTVMYSGGKLRFQTELLPRQLLQYRIHDLDMTLLQLLYPDVLGIFPESGLLNGTGQLHIQKNSATDTIKGKVEFNGKKIQLSNRSWQSRPFAGSISARMILPLNSGLLKLTPVKMDINGGKALQISVDGSLPLLSACTSMNWKLTAVPEKLLPILDDKIKLENMQYLTAFSPLNLTGSGKLNFSPGETVLQDHRLVLTGKDQSSAALNLAEHRLSGESAENQPWNWTLSASIPAAQLPFHDRRLQFTGGKFQIQGTLNSSADFSDWSFSAENSWKNISGQLCSHSIADISGGAEISIQGRLNGDFSMNRSVLFCRSRGNPVLRLENYGDGNFIKGEFSNTTTLRYANEVLLNTFLPWNLTGGQCSGNISINGNWKKQQYDGQGYASFSQLKAPDLKQPISGELRCSYSKPEGTAGIPQFRLNLNQEDGTHIADIDLAMQHPKSASGSRRLQLTSSEINMEKINALFGSAPVSRAPEHTVWDFGPQRTQLDLLLKKIYWDPANPIAVRGKILMQRNRLQIPRLNCSIGGGELAITAGGMDFPTGMMLNISCRQLSPVRLKQITTLCFPESNLEGTLENSSLELKFRRLYTSSWGEDLVGKCQLHFRDLTLPVKAAQGPLSRILLLPVETMIRTEKIMPSTKNVREHFQQLWQGEFDPQSPLACLKFSTGEVLLQADNGRLNFQKMNFIGTPVTKMSVAGYTEMQDPGNLKLDFDVTLSGIRAKIPIRGTTASPQIAAWQLFGMMPKTWSNMLGFSQESNVPVKSSYFSPLWRSMQNLPKVLKNK